MAAGKVDRGVLSSNYQQPGDIYQDGKTEGAFEVVAQQVDENYDYAKSIDDYAKGLVTSGTLIPLPPEFLSRQAIINGNFDRWERDTTVTNPSYGRILADRWRLYNAAISVVFPSSIIHSQQILTPGNIPNAYYFYRVNPNEAGSGFGASDVYLLQQFIEYGTRYLAGTNKKVTLSFWARSSIANKKIGVYVSQRYGSGGSPSAGEDIAGQAFSLTPNWTKYTVTFTLNSLVGKTFGSNNDDTLNVNFLYAWGNSGYASIVNSPGIAETFGGSGNIDIAQVQLCAGEFELPFQPLSIREEENQSKRFCHVISGFGSNKAIVGNGFAATTTVAFINVRLPDMRIPPTLVATASQWDLDDGFTSTTLTSLTIQSLRDSKNEVVLRAQVASGLTAQRPYQLLSNLTTSKMIFDAEL